MNILDPGAIDCDVHPSLPGLSTLLPYMSEAWRARLEDQGIFELDSISYPTNNPIAARYDWRPETGKAGSSVDLLRSQALDHFGIRLAICNCLYGVQLLFDEHFAVEVARALNDWMAKEWLDQDPRLRASIVVPTQNPEKAAEEINRCATDKRFVQVLLLVMDEMPLGRSYYWPIYAAAQRHGLPVGIHAGSSYRHPVTPVGWPSYYTEDYFAQAQAFQTQLTSLVFEGVFSKFPELRVVMMESGVTWLPSHLWRLTKHWRGIRSEVAWVHNDPAEIVRKHFRFTLQPFDRPHDTDQLLRILDHFESDELLLFSTDYPHYQFDDDEVVPRGLPTDLVEKITTRNPLSTYPRLKEAVG